MLLYELQYKILVKIPDSVLHSALSLWEKKREKKYELRMLSNLVKNV